ncbi:hypothetical protein FNU79_18380 [Deinococcus detaillensis]|uniref:DUF2154 domain-containing protein n=1 Tax=Deinococcus detaillensis TaxID=2592048 RepID=A0A553UFR9_9DEIO|nr:hypothetical protein [Deinococcus detaillensis]TSA79059.1 hypothetical protein FNU79_18380 [Deinococcus detaillensis]
MSTAERTPTRMNNPPTTPKPQPKVSRWAYVLIVIGLLALFDVIGLESFGTPLVMIGIGVALLTRPYAWGRTLGLVLVSLVLVVIGGWYFIRPALPAGPSTQTVSLPLSAARAEIQLATTVGRLDIGPTTSGKLIDGTLNLGRNDRLDRTFSTRGDTQVVSLAARNTGPNVILPWNNGLINSRWIIGLTPSVPLVLRVETGVGESTLNLEGLKVTDLSLRVGVGQATVHLPATGIVTAAINGGVGQLLVTLPRSMEARIKVDSGIGAVRVLGDFQRDGDTYTSSGYAGASNRTDLQIDGGIGQITVEQAGR